MRYRILITNIFFVFQNLDSEIVVEAARAGNSAAISANLVFDERQMNALFLDVVCCSKNLITHLCLVTKVFFLFYFKDHQKNRAIILNFHFFRRPACLLNQHINILHSRFLRSICCFF